MILIKTALLIATIAFVSSLSGPLEAYLDPGTGSMAIQMILAGVVAGIAAAKVYWHKISSLIFRRETKNQPTLLD